MYKTGLILQRMGGAIALISSIIVGFLSLGLMTNIFGVLLGGIIAFILLPIVVLVAPFYDAFSNDFWLPLQIKGVMLCGIAIFLMGFFLERSSER